MDVGVTALDVKTEEWVRSLLPAGAEITDVTVLDGGWSSLVRCLATGAGDLVLRSMIRPSLADRAPEMLTREAGVLDLLAPTGIPVPRVLGVDPWGSRCGWPSLLMTRVPGRVRIDEGPATGERAVRLARQLAAVHRFRPPETLRPPAYVAWAWPGEITIPAGTERPRLWHRAEQLISRVPPGFAGCFLHRDFHPGNVLFDGPGVTGIVDWTETSWGPADLDVAHCATMLALLHGDELSDAFVRAYASAGGHLATDRATHLYWRLLDALSFAPDAANAGGPWRDLGRDDLTPPVLAAALERHLAHLLTTFG